MARWYNRTLTTKPVIVVGLLTAAFRMMSDFVETAGTIELEVESVGFVKSSSYDGVKQMPTTDRRFDLMLDTDVRGKNVVVLDVVADSGESIARTVSSLLTYQPRSVTTMVLIATPRARKKVWLDYVAVETTNEHPWYVGYGLDLDQRHREENVIWACPEGQWK